MNFAVILTSVYGQESKAIDFADSVYVIKPTEMWENKSKQFYYALPETFARRALAAHIMRDSLSILYLDEVEKVIDLKEELDRVSEQQVYERILIGILTLIIVIRL